MNINGPLPLVLACLHEKIGRCVGKRLSCAGEGRKEGRFASLIFGTNRLDVIFCLMASVYFCGNGSISDHNRDDVGTLVAPLK